MLSFKAPAATVPTKSDSCGGTNALGPNCDPAPANGGDGPDVGETWAKPSGPVKETEATSLEPCPAPMVSFRLGPTVCDVGGMWLNLTGHATECTLGVKPSNARTRRNHTPGTFSGSVQSIERCLRS